MKAVIVNCFETNENRVELLYDFLSKKGYDVTVIQSDFKHIMKKHRTDSKNNHIFVKSAPYYKNLSVARLSSHYNFSKEAFKLVEKIIPDLIYTIFPPNSLAKFAAEYKKTHKNVKLIFDLMDLWPETMPIGKIKNFPPFTFWKQLRDKSLRYADLVITECDLYKKVLGYVLKGIRTNTVYLAKKDINIESKPILSQNELHLCYLGSINNIIDIPKIKAIISSIIRYKSVSLHIIGDGENKDILIDEVKAVGAKVIYHGKIYDPQEKQAIFDRCHLGINVMKDSVCVGLTMKSIDYFQHGLPIINNIKADTESIVVRYKVGVNILDDDYEHLANELVQKGLEEFLQMRNNAYNTFNKLFSKRAFEKNMNELIKEL